jgi:hypothetical protein
MDKLDHLVSAPGVAGQGPSVSQSDTGIFGSNVIQARETKNFEPEQRRSMHQSVLQFKLELFVYVWAEPGKLWDRSPYGSRRRSFKSLAIWGEKQCA